MNKKNSQASFTVKVTDEQRNDFAKLSGDFNPLHTDTGYAAQTEFKRCVLHGAFSAGLLSRMAGMHLPGTECLLHSMNLRFVRPVFPPCELKVEGRILRDDGENGEVETLIRANDSGLLLVEGSYRFGRHTKQISVPQSEQHTTITPNSKEAHQKAGKVIVTGAGGGLGGELLAMLGERGLGVTSKEHPSLIRLDSLEQIESTPIKTGLVDAIVHCAWPSPDNDALLANPAPASMIEHHLAAPLRDCLALARLLSTKGRPGALLILVGSSSSLPGRHNWRSPMYSLAKSILPTLSKILSLELGATGQRVLSVYFDVLDGGINMGLSEAVRQAQADRLPSGELPTLHQAASQLRWLLDNPCAMISGASIELTGGAIP